MPTATKKMTEKKDKTESMTFRVTQKEREIIERHAEKEGFTVSQYCRAAVFMDMAISGNIDALKFVFSVIGEGLKDNLRSKFRELQESKPALA